MITSQVPCGTKFLLEFIFADWRLFAFSGKIFAVISCYLRELIFALDYEELKKLNNPKIALVHYRFQSPYKS